MSPVIHAAGLWPRDIPRPTPEPPLLDLLAAAAGPRRTVEVVELDADGRVRIVVRGKAGIVVAERGAWEASARRAIARLFLQGPR